MFAEVWSWAGEFRQSNKNLGVDKHEIGVELKKLLDDCRYWIETRAFVEDEIAVRISHRMVTIHPFANGHGRHSRLFADVLVSNGLGRPYFSWGSINLATKGVARAEYLNAIREADEGNYKPLIKFARD
jgi:Fic-DOC domain mobile mystery protein B